MLIYQLPFVTNDIGMYHLIFNHVGILEWTKCSRNDDYVYQTYLLYIYLTCPWKMKYVVYERIRLEIL